MSIMTGEVALHRYLRWLGLLLILVVGVHLRLGTAAYTQVDGPVRADAMDYVAYAWNLKYLGVYSRDPAGMMGRSTAAPKPDAVRPPGYSLLLLPWVPLHIDARFVRDIKFLQAWLAVATLLCSTLLAMELLGTWIGLALGALVALSPHQSVYVGYLLTETLYGLVLMLALAAGVWALKMRRPRWRLTLAGLSGVLFGLSCLVRPTLDQWAWVLLVLLLLWPPIRRFRREIMVLAMGFVLAMAPWWIRNEVSVHQVSNALKMRQTVQQGSYPDFMYKGRPETFGYPYRFDPGAAKAESSWAGTLGDLRDKFEQRPGTMLRWYLFGKVSYFFHWSSPEGWGDIYIYKVLRSPWLSQTPFIVAESLMHGIYAPLIVLGLLGMLVVWLPLTRKLFDGFQTDAMRWLALLHLYAIGVHVAGAPFARYSVPFRPLTFVLALFCLLWLIRYYQMRKRGLGADIAHA